ncbi:hypothetical protein NC77_17180 [Janthinobacterium lividum]|uniref:hypothetical protein n=1 Tax=Janthinobacterium lividum TaxID=29581 RepID=UPI000538A950|nr:hypothetical protein [Janthinobacterium lividum]KHA77549.1 hypothetical protein NC77_17180 [Janthinobacterium lividum]
MSIRKYDKDHLKERSGVASAALVVLEGPESGDPLIFWTKHDTESHQINLHEFAEGRIESKTGKEIFTPFSGRPHLIRQLATGIKDQLLGARPRTASNWITALRAWWRILDAVEAAAEQTGTCVTRLEDVRQLTAIHAEFAHRCGMNAMAFSLFRTLADTIRLAIGARALHWQAPERPDVKRHLPPEDQVKVLRFALMHAWRGVLEKWALIDRFLSEFAITANNSSEADLHRHAQYMRSIQRKFWKVLPTPDELRDGVHQASFSGKTGLNLKTLRGTVFPTRWDVDAAFHLCLANTGWNQSTLLALDVEKKILFTHPKDHPDNFYKRFVLNPETYALTGNKARSGNKEQKVVGLWKTTAGPGHIIRIHMERVEPLRELLKARLVEERRRYVELARDGISYEESASQFERVQRLEQGCRSVWLYVDGFGDIVWLHSRNHESYFSDDGKKMTFLTFMLNQLNAKRAVQNKVPIPHVTQADFRDFFAAYVWRASGGNILAVKRALGHARLGTTSGYLDNNVLNKEADDAARGFLNALVDELGKGRLDLTILAHLHRYGTVTPELEQRLAEYRAMARSRMKIACKEPRNPPSQIRISGQGFCDDNRCLLCPENAVLLPESYDGIAMRVEEILELQACLPIETWLNADYPLELKNNLAALRLFDLNLVLRSRQHWARAIANGEHYVPGVPVCIDEVKAT